jgi:hypothetical protein
MRRALATAAAVWGAAAFAVWNGFFDVLVTRGEKQYLLDQARHDAGLGPPAAMDAVMRETIRDAAFKASLWALVVLAAGLLGSWLVWRAARREAPGGTPRG